MAQCLAAVREIVVDALPDVAAIEPFGSAANGLGVRSGNDIDVTVVIPELLALSDEPPEDEEEEGQGRDTGANGEGAKGEGVNGEGANGEAPQMQMHAARAQGGEGRAEGTGEEEERPRPRRKRGPRTETYGKLIGILGEVFSEASSFDNVKAITTARVPVLKVRHVPSGVSCDVTMNNLLALHNTRMLRDYVSIDPRVKALTMIVKHWAKRRAVNEAYRGTLSSYCYVVMCIHCLQNRPVPVLPVLQEGDVEPQEVLGWNVAYRCVGVPLIPAHVDWAGHPLSPSPSPSPPPSRGCPPPMQQASGARSRRVRF